jgi:hypothetical protein
MGLGWGGWGQEIYVGLRQPWLLMEIMHEKGTPIMDGIDVPIAMRA